MDKSLVIGLIVIAVAYGVLWFFIIKSNKIIDKMNQNH